MSSGCEVAQEAKCFVEDACLLFGDGEGDPNVRASRGSAASVAVVSAVVHTAGTAAIVELAAR